MTNESISLKEYFEAKLDNIEKSTSLARQSMDDRLARMNEFRDTLKDQASRFVTRDETYALLSKIDAKIDALELSKAMLEGKASQNSVNTALMFSVIGVIVSIVSILIKF